VPQVEESKLNLYQYGTAPTRCSRRAFLAGAYEQHLRGNDRLIPGWTRLNGAAHGDLDGLKRLAKTLNVHELPSLAEHSDKAWSVAQAVIAAEVVEPGHGKHQVVRAHPTVSAHPSRVLPHGGKQSHGIGARCADASGSTIKNCLRRHILR
jgi:hypothetical protein